MPPFTPRLPDKVGTLVEQLFQWAPKIITRTKSDGKRAQREIGRRNQAPDNADLGDATEPHRVAAASTAHRMQQEDLLMHPLSGRHRAMALQALAVSAFLAIVPADAAAEANPLAAERWKTRPVVVVVPARGDALIRRIDAALAQTATREAFIDREMVLYTVEAGQGRSSGKPLDAARTRALLAALELDAGGPPAFVLVGKDGGVKLRAGADVDLQAVFAEIDRMPMRRR